jgi:uncharacterized membrane protein YdjX (TVP38/TMEM64 family)
MKYEHFSNKITKFKKDFGKIGAVAGITTVMPIVGSMFLLTVVYQISPWLQENKEIGVLIFVVFMTIFSGLALLATNILGIVSGFAFDFTIGIVAQIVGLAGASTLMFLLAKRYASKNFLSIIEEKPKLKAIHHALLNESVFKTLLIITLIRLSPAMPFAVTNFIISASGVSFKTFILGTVLGMTPRASAVVFVGSSLSELNFSQPQESWLLILGIAATILSVLAIGTISRRALNNLILKQNA